MFDMKSYQKEYQKNNKEKRKQYCLINKERINKRRRQYRLEKGITKKPRSGIKMDRKEYKNRLKENGTWWMKRGNRTEQNRRYREKYYFKVRAHRKLNLAVKNGIILRPNQCNDCGSNEYIQGHHDNYDEPLIVRWLCHKCHNKIHKESEGKKMADKICPPVKSVPKSDGMKYGSASMTLTTPDPVFGRYFGANVDGSNAVDSSKIMGAK